MQKPGSKPPGGSWASYSHDEILMVSAASGHRPLMHPVVLCPGSAIDRYEIVRPIASGGGGTVYEAIDGSLRRRVALKVLHVRALGTAHARRAAERFLAEVRIATQIRHPHVVDVFDVGTAEGVPFLVMELVEGETLEQLVAREKQLALARAIEIALPLLSAVVELHENGVVHRDLKPANVLLGAGPALWPKLADFGVSRCHGEPASSLDEGTLLGTPDYLAPEVIAGEPATPASDQYALGVLLYECTTGHKPCPGATEAERLRAAVHAAVVAPSAHAPSLPRAFDAVVMRALSRDPARRFGSIRELAASLLPFAARGVAERWSDEFVALPSETRPREVAALSCASCAVAEAGDATRATTIDMRDGVALSSRGDTLTMVWQSAARLPRTRWAFDRIDRFAAGKDGGILVLMIVLPSADPPDAAARLENERRTRILAHRIRRFATVVIGDTVWQVLVRGIIRAMVMPHRQLSGGTITVDFTVEAGVTAMLDASGPRTPSFARIFSDVQALYAALGEDAPTRTAARRSRSGIDLRGARRARKSA
jgi:hypothetical protein